MRSRVLSPLSRKQLRSRSCLPYAEKNPVTKPIILRGGDADVEAEPGTKSAIQSRGDRRDLIVVVKSIQHNGFKTPKLSKLQRYILLEAVKSLSGLEKGRESQ
jgi:hypothetical protein